MDCNIFYRISSKSYPKVKLPLATKEFCLANFMKVFGNKFIVVADNCDDELLTHLKSLGLNVIETNLGNAGAFMRCVEMASMTDPDSLVYFVEDDYLHLPQAPQLLTEAIHYADYVSVYDHPDKYGPMYDGGEISKVFKTKSSHWKFSQSTTMTFATTVKTLREDYDYWHGIKGDHPNDHELFVLLGNRRNRTLAVSVPGAACHVDLTYSADIGYDTMEKWAVDMVIKKTLDGLDDQKWGEAYPVLTKMKEQKMTGLQMAACLEVLIKK